jgi:hypothetical protein
LARFTGQNLSLFASKIYRLQLELYFKGA